MRNKLRHGGCIAVLAAAASLTLAAGPVAAATITWGAATNISGDTDVDTTGTLVRAFSLNGTGTTVNTVNFEAFTAPSYFLSTTTATVGDFTLSGDYFYGSDDITSPSAPFTTLSNPYQSLLGSQDITTGDATLVMAGLTAGQTYEFEVWSNDSAEENTFGLLASSPGDPGAFLSSGNTGNLGQFVIGTFVADAGTQTVDFSPGESGAINGFQLRQLATEVPEPGTLSLAGMAGFALLASRRRAKSKA